MIEQSIQELIQYGIAKELVTEEDSIFLRNQLMDLLRLSSWETPALPEVLPSIDEILDKLVSYATENGIIADSNAARDLFDTRIMGLLTDMPHTVNRAFFTAYHKSPEEATDWYYQYSKDTNYVRMTAITARWISPSTVPSRKKIPETLPPPRTSPRPSIRRVSSASKTPALPER